MSSLAPRPRRRLRRLAFVTAVLAVTAAGLWLFVWTTVERHQRENWIRAVEHLEVAAEAKVDPLDSSALGRFRGWLSIPRVHVYLSKDSEGRRLLRAPAGEPRRVLIQIERPLSDEVLDRLAARFPAAEFRSSPGGLGGGGMGGMGGGQGFF